MRDSLVKSFAISFRLKSTYRVNTILYRLQRILSGLHLFPRGMFAISWLKTCVVLVTAVWEVVGMFLGKLVYVGVMYAYITVVAHVSPPLQSSALLTGYLLLTLAGGCLDSWMFNFSRQDYYAIVLMRMNARSRALSGFAYSAFRSMLGLLPSLLFFGLLLGSPWWALVVMAFLPSAVKTLVCAGLMLRYERSGKFNVSKPLEFLTWPLAIALTALAAILIIVPLPIPWRVCASIMPVIIVAGIGALPLILGFRRYPELCKMGATQSIAVLDSVSEGSMRRKRMDKVIRFDKSDAHTGSGKTGLAYLNALFMARHRKILWGASLRYSAICAAAVVAAVIAYLVMPDRAPDPVTFLPWMLLVMYFVNRGTVMTEALYTNCDHSLLTYPFYKQPGRILELFRLRLWEISKINLLPAGVLGAGIAVLMAIKNPTRPLYEFVIAFLSILVIGVFFSVHYLALYYLLQPYNVAAQIKNFPYQIAVGLTYAGCYGIAINYTNPSLLVFGTASLAFCVLYSLAACLAVFRFAPRTFRIKA